MPRPRLALIVLLCLAAGTGPATADPDFAACTALGKMFDTLGRDNGVGRHWTVATASEAPLKWAVMQVGALPTVEVGNRLYDAAVQKAGGSEKLPSPWYDGLDLDAEMSRLFAGRHLDAALLSDIVLANDHVYGVLLPMQPERLVIAASGGTMHCASWWTFVADGATWRESTPTFGPDDNCYSEPSLLALAGGYYIAHAPTADSVSLLPLGEGEACTLTIEMRRMPLLDLKAVGAADPTIRALAQDLATLAQGGTVPADRFRPEEPAESLTPILGDAQPAAALPLFDFLDLAWRPSQGRPEGSTDIYRLGTDAPAGATPEQVAAAGMLALVPGDTDVWSELEGVGVQFFGYAGRHFVWSTGIPHIGWRELSPPGFGVFEIDGEKLVPRLGGHMQNDAQYIGATAGPESGPAEQ
jgi:hypothetical protein